MPFKKVGNDDYTSPSGRHFNEAQVRLYHANGDKFPGERKARGGPVMQGARRVATPPVARRPTVQLPSAAPPPGAGVPTAPPNKGFQGAPVGMAAGGPVLGRTLSFAKHQPGKDLPGAAGSDKDEFAGGRMPGKMTDAVPQQYGNKGAPAKRTGDKSERAVKPRT